MKCFQVHNKIYCLLHFQDKISGTQDSIWLAQTIGTGTANHWFVTDSLPAYSGNHSWMIHELQEKSQEALVLNPNVYSFEVTGTQPVFRFIRSMTEKLVLPVGLSKSGKLDLPIGKVSMAEFSGTHMIAKWITGHFFHRE